MLTTKQQHYFSYPSSKHLCKSIKAILWYDFCLLLAGLISHFTWRGLSACSGLGDWLYSGLSDAGYLLALKHAGK